MRWPDRDEVFQYGGFILILSGCFFAAKDGIQLGQIFCVVVGAICMTKD